MQHTDQPVQSDVTPAPSAGRKPRLVLKPRLPAGDEALTEIRRYLLLRPVALGCVCLLLILHWAVPGPFDFTTVVLVGAAYALLIGSGGLEAARLSGSGGDLRRQERLAEDAIKRAGRLQSHLEPGTATDDLVGRILTSGHDPRRAVILAGNEVEDALRAVYRHFAENERLASTSTGADLPLSFMVQELIWRGLLAPDIYDTAEPVLGLREMALAPRAHIEPRTASDAARAAQAVVLRVESLGIEIRPRRVPLAWMRNEHAVARADVPAQRTEIVVSPPEQPHETSPEEDEDVLRFPRTRHEGQSSPPDQAEDGEGQDGTVHEVNVPETNHRRSPPQQGDTEPADPIVP